MEKTKSKILSIVIAIILILSTLMTTVAALDLTQTTGSLTITKYQITNGTQSVLAGVTFDIYKIADDETSTEIPTDADILATKQSDTTDEYGVVEFTGLALGRYLVVESAAPANVTEKIANFIVDIPMTSSDGTSLIYDVEVYPKNNTVYGGIVLTKEDEEGNALSGVKFELQKLNGTIWESYDATLVTSDETGYEGTITITGLPTGNYRFVETETLDGYILDNNTTYEFTVSGDGTSTTVTPSAITVTNEKPTISKEITTTLTNGSANIGDTISFEVTADVPSTIASLTTYKIVDTLSEGLTYDEDSLVIKGDGTTNLTGSYTAVYNDADRTITVTFTNADLANYDTVVLTYDAKLNSNADATTTGNTNSVVLTYSTAVTTDYEGNDNPATTDETDPETATVYTGGFWIYKTDNSSTPVALEGAEFKVASSEANAKAGIYLTDESGADIVLTTDVDGKASYKGLAYGDYWLVETKAPSYDDEGTTKYYNLLTKPVQITVSSTTYDSTTATATITNKKGFTLPATGGSGTVAITIVGITLIVIGVVVAKRNNKEEK